jgi:hypothetical protein
MFVFLSFLLVSHICHGQLAAKCLNLNCIFSGSTLNYSICLIIYTKGKRWFQILNEAFYCPETCYVHLYFQYIYSYLCTAFIDVWSSVLGISILSLSTILLLEYGTVTTVWYEYARVAYEVWNINSIGRRGWYITIKVWKIYNGKTGSRLFYHKVW